MVIALEKHYRKYYKQEFVEVPSGAEPPFDTMKKLVDGTEIKGLFIPDQSTGVLIASAPNIATKGRFLTNSSALIKSRDTLRSEDLGFFISVINDPLIAPDFSPTQSKRYLAEVVERPAQEASNEST